MGLCKCERKKVTNLFCFEHRVNVCEFCLISNHSKCIVKSYLHWLKDSDFSSLCSLCSKALDDKNAGECIRLMCLDVFHWQCLDSFASALPPTTAPAGYECPCCAQYIIPLSNQGGPVAEALRTKLKKSIWMKSNFSAKLSTNRSHKSQSSSPPIMDFNEGKLLDPSLDAYATKFLKGDDTAVYTQPKPIVPTSTVVSIDENVEPLVAITTATQSIPATPPSMTRFERRHLNEATTSPAFLVPSSSQQLITSDVEEDKYRRRTLTKIVGQKFGLSGVWPVLNLYKLRQYRILGIIGLVVLIFLVFVLMLNIYSDPNERGDPLLDPILNPEIHVAGVISPHKL